MGGERRVEGVSGKLEVVNSLLRRWDPWRAIHGRNGSKIHPSDRETSVMSFKLVWAYDWQFLNS